MKRIEDIEKMEWDALESAAQGQEVPVPPGLEDRIKASLAAQSLLKKDAKPAPARWVSFAAIAVAASLAAVTLIPKYHADNLTDTFEDPYLAYAQVEATFQKIADKMAAGVDLAAKAGETAEKTVEIIQKVTE